MPAAPYFPTHRAGYWISPTGRFFLVENSHIETICNHPEKFGTDEAALRAVFAQYKEPYRSERNARAFIIKRLVLNGWIRLRNYHEGWSLNMSGFTPENLCRVTNFFQQLYKDKFDLNDVCLDAPEGKRRTGVPEILRHAILPGRDPKDLPTYPVTFLKSAALIEDAEVRPVTLTD